MKGVDWSKIRKVLLAVELSIRVIIGYLYTILATMTAEKVPPDGILCVPNSTARSLCRLARAWYCFILIKLSAKALWEPFGGNQYCACWGSDIV
jgi:hypothetical protein